MFMAISWNYNGNSTFLDPEFDGGDNGQGMV